MVGLCRSKLPRARRETHRNWAINDDSSSVSVQMMGFAGAHPSYADIVMYIEPILNKTLANQKVKRPK